MKELMKQFWQEEEGFGTVELVILIGVLVAVALIARKALVSFVNDLITKIFKPSDVPANTST